MHPNALLGIPTKFKKMHSGVVIPASPKSSGGPPPLTPGFVSEATYKQMTEHRPGVMIYDGNKLGNPCVIYYPFPSSSLRARSYYKYSTVCWVPTDRNYLEGHTIIELDSFKFKKLPEIQEFVQARDGISFVIEDMQAARNFIRDMKTHFTRKFPFITPRKWNSNSIVSGNPVLLVTFLDLSLCIPIFNHKKSLGMGVMISLTKKDYLQPGHMVDSIMEINFLAGYDKANILVVDGVKLGSHKFPGSDVVGHMLTQIDKQISVKKKLSKGGKEEPRSIKAKGGAVKLSADSAYSRYRITTSSTSSTSNW